MSDEKKTPVMILSGLDAAGKASLLKNVFSNKEGIKVAVILEEIDYEWFGNNFDGDELQIEEEFVRFKNGCLVGIPEEDASQEVCKLA